MTKKSALIIILAVSALLGLYGLSRGDTVNDEVFMSFRGIGMLDFDEAAAQTTPLEWFDPNIPWWTKLSFHDHPPLVLAVQNIFMKIFGESNFGFRLPSALLGIASVYLVYLIGRWLYSDSVGLIGAAIFGFTLNHLYISRVGMQEAYVIFFLLLASYFFLKSLKNDRYLILTGIAVGLGLLAKYNTGIIVPIFATYLLFFKREYFKNKKFWLGALLALVIFSPVIIYNIGLYRAVGHFDFQLSYIFGQHPEVWKVAPGKEIGTLMDRLLDFMPRLIATNSWLFLAFSGTSVLAFLYGLVRRGRETLAKHIYLLLVIGYLSLLLLLIGPSYRFLTMLTPFAALMTAVFLDAVRQRFFSDQKNLAYGLFALVLIFEISYSINNQILYYPWPRANSERYSPWLASKVRFENYNWGYNQLGAFFEQELAGLVPALTFDVRYQFLEKLREQALERGLASGAESYPALIVYDGNFDLAGKLWTLDRLHIYHAWPVLSLETHNQYLKERGSDYYEHIGFKVRYFVMPSNTFPSGEARLLQGGERISIRNSRGDEAFVVYKKEL